MKVVLTPVVQIKFICRKHSQNEMCDSNELALMLITALKVACRGKKHGDGGGGHA